MVDPRCDGGRTTAPPPVRAGISRVASAWTVAPILASNTASTSPTPGGGSHSREAVRRRPWVLIRSNSRRPRRTTPSSTPSSARADGSPGPEDSTHRGGHTVAFPARTVRSRSCRASTLTFLPKAISYSVSVRKAMTAKPVLAPNAALAIPARGSEADRGGNHRQTAGPTPRRRPSHPPSSLPPVPLPLQPRRRGQPPSPAGPPKRGSGPARGA